MFLSFVICVSPHKSTMVQLRFNLISSFIEVWVLCCGVMVLTSPPPIKKKSEFQIKSQNGGWGTACL